MNIQQGLVFVKTPKGEDEVRTRGMQLDRNARLVLILIDGQITASELIQKLPGTDNVPSFIAMLWREGLIEPAGSFGALDDKPVEAPQPSYLTDDTVESNSSHTSVIVATSERIEPSISTNDFQQSEKSVAAPAITRPAAIAREAMPTRSTNAVPTNSQTSSITFIKPKRELPPFRVNGRKLRMALLWGACSIAALLTLAIIGLPFVRLPVHMLAGNKAVAALCGAEATYEGIKLQILPSPLLKIQSVQGGRCPAMAELSVGASVTDWLSDVPHITSLHLSGVELSAAQLWPTLAQARLNDISADEDLPLTFADIQIKTAFGGVTNLAGDGQIIHGQLTKLALATEDKTSSIGLMRNTVNTWRLQLVLPAVQISSVRLASLQASGEWSSQGLRFDSLNAVTGGGKISGHALLSNQTDQLSADLSLNGVAADSFVFGTLRVISEGDVSGQLHVQLAGAIEKPLKDRLQLSGDLKIANGSLSGADLLDVAQTDQASYQASGRTLFLDSRVRVSMNNDRWKLSGLQLTGAAVDAHGDLSSDNERVTGSLVILSAKLNLPATAWLINGTQGSWKFQRRGGVKVASPMKNLPAEVTSETTETVASQ